MEIGPVSNQNQIQPRGEREPLRPAPEKERPELADKVEISDDARARLAEMADARLEAEQQARREKLAMIRERMETGFYDRPEVKEQIADRLIDDLDI
jgi:anti-sigma28 factor (negative regulator of flagellin synthesis)